MTTERSYRPARAQKDIIADLIVKTCNDAGVQVPSFSRDYSSMIAALQEVLHTAPLEKIPVDDVLANLVAGSRNKRGGISAVRASDLERTGNLLLDRYLDYHSAEDGATALEIIFAILGAFVPIYGVIKNVLHDFRVPQDAFLLLSEFGSDPLSAAHRNEVVSFCVSQYNMLREDGYNLRIEWLYILAQYVLTDNEQRVLLQLCNSHRSPYAHDPQLMKLTGDESLEVQLIMHQRLHRQEVAKEFLYAHLNDDTMRKAAVNIAAKDGEFEEAVALCKERIGEVNDETNPDGLYEWYVLILRVGTDAMGVAPDSGRFTDCVYMAALWLFHRTGNYEYYVQLKSLRNGVQWQYEWEDIIEPVEVRRHENTLVQIFLEEKAWERLEHLMGFLSFRQWELFEEEFFVRCPALFERHFDKAVWWMLGSNGFEQDTEVKMAEYLGRMVGRFGVARVSSVVSLVKAMYPRRKKLHRILEEVVGGFGSA